MYFHIGYRESGSSQTAVKYKKKSGRRGLGSYKRRGAEKVPPKKMRSKRIGKKALIFRNRTGLKTLKLAKK